MDILSGASAIAPIASIAAKMAENRYWLEYFVLLVGIGGWGFGVLSWWSAAVRKSYAAEQDFRSISQRLKELGDMQKVILHDQDRRFDEIDKDLREIKAFNQASIIQRGDSNSGILRGRGGDFPG